MSTTAIPHLGRRPSPPSAAQLAASLKRTTFLLSSTRLVISDPVARRMATASLIVGPAGLACSNGTAT